MGKSRIVHMVLEKRPDGKRLVENPKRRLENNIKMDRK
jgi:RNase P/RNase MRP subunit p29